SIIALLEKRDTGKALDLAVEARDLCEVAQGMPGAGTAKRTLDAHIHCCELLAGSASETLVSTLESTITKLPSIASFIPIWSLMIYYSSVGNKEASEIKTLKLRRMAPHCKPLLGEATAPSQGV
ncbi:MAG TPA: hypothetical protein VG897_00260, partial [Terriglobales bacterium]|nr:hypothetical protein [Terriglobales bacterium]